jgi:hypothetical protein
MKTISPQRVFIEIKSRGVLTLNAVHMRVLAQNDRCLFEFEDWLNANADRFINDSATQLMEMALLADFIEETTKC